MQRKSTPSAHQKWLGDNYKEDNKSDIQTKSIAAKIEDNTKLKGFPPPVDPTADVRGIAQVPSRSSSKPKPEPGCNLI